MKELKDTADLDYQFLMFSKDYKNRFKAEFYQLKKRYEELKVMLDKWDNGELDFTPTCPRDIFNKQIVFLEYYLDILADRAEIEGIEL